VSALANTEVGNYLNKHFASSYQKVGTFKLVNGQKQGGNVASYFCTADGEVLHAIPGPVDAATLLRESRWVVETYKKARLDGSQDTLALQQAFRRAHVDRVPAGAMKVNWKQLPFYQPTEEAIAMLLDTNPTLKKLDQQGQVHFLLALYPLVKLEKVYKAVYEKVLNEKISTRPVEERN
jgi:hypothetical protein